MTTGNNKKHSLTIYNSMWQWAIENDPDKKKSPGDFIRSLLQEQITQKKAEMKAKQEEEDPFEDDWDDDEYDDWEIEANPTKIVKTLSEEENELKKMLEDEGIFMSKSPTRETQTSSVRRSKCIVTKLKNNKKDKPTKSCYGKEIRFMRVKLKDAVEPNKIRHLPFLEKYYTMVRNVWDYIEANDEAV